MIFIFKNRHRNNVVKGALSNSVNNSGVVEVVFNYFYLQNG